MKICISPYDNLRQLSPYYGVWGVKDGAAFSVRRIVIHVGFGSVLSAKNITMSRIYAGEMEERMIPVLMIFLVI